MSKRYTEGICHDGAAILDNGQMITIIDVLDRLNTSEKLQQKADQLEAVKVSEHRFIDENEAWGVVHELREGIFKKLDRAKLFCEIEEYPNKHGDGGTYILKSRCNFPLLVATIYRNDSNKTILHLVEHRKRLEEFLEKLKQIKGE